MARNRILLQISIVVLLAFSTTSSFLENWLQQPKQLNEDYAIDDKSKNVMEEKHDRLVALELKMSLMELKLEELRVENQEQQSLIASLHQQQVINNQRTHSIHSKYAVPGLNPVAISGTPKSCADLYSIGHISGMHLVMGTKQVETVYCDFTKLPTQAGFETKIGQVDVQSTPVYFYVQRNSNYSTEGVPIPFQVTRLNVGNAMNIASGIFTAPKTGVYSFSFSGICAATGTTAVVHTGLYVNSVLFARGHGQSTYATFTIQSTLQLNAADKVSVQLLPSGTGTLFDDGAHHTHFTGWLLHEDL